MTDNSDTPLEKANIIAKPADNSSNLKFSISDHLGRFKLTLNKNMKYEITVSYLGFGDSVNIYEANSKKTTYLFKLQRKHENLNEIVIDYKYKPISIKKDTIIYNVSFFAKGNERKMKEVLEKMPGIEVDKNGNVMVQGKKVTKMLVEGDSFFGGGTKLAVENIPADALDKIEIIDNFNEVNFLKTVSDSDDLAMNVKLKENKKKFIFGDIDLGKGLNKINDSYHLLHSALFYYSPEKNISFIGDVNNIGKKTFSFEDMLRFQGGTSDFLTQRKSLINLHSFSDENKNLIKNESVFTALDYKKKVNDKFDINTYTIFSKQNENLLDVSNNSYLENNSFTKENVETNNLRKSLIGIGNLKLNFNPSSTEKVLYNSQLQFSNNDINNNITSRISEADTSIFQTLGDNINFSFKHFFEWHKQYKDIKHKTSFIVNHTYEKETPQKRWITNMLFLTDFIPLENDSLYRINQIKKQKRNTLDVLFKHYWITNNTNHIYTSIGANLENSTLTTSEEQLLSDNSINDFFLNGFGNKLKYKFYDVFLNLEYKFKLGKLTNKPSLNFHLYNLKVNQINSITLNRFLIEPQWKSEYRFNSSESIKFAYKYTNKFPNSRQYLERFTLLNYNSIFRGNTLLNNEKFHALNLRYTNMSSYRNLLIFGFLNYVRKTSTLRNTLRIDGINQFTTPIITDNPETMLQLTGSVEKKIYRLKARLNLSLNRFDYIQNLNEISTYNVRNSQKIGINVRTSYRKWPSINLGYSKKFNQFIGLTDSSFETDNFNFNFNIDFFKYFTFETDYELNIIESNNLAQNSTFNIANASLTYSDKKSPLSFKFFAQNYLNNKKINESYFSDFLITKKTTFTLPRIFMLSISYKL